VLTFDEAGMWELEAFLERHMCIPVKRKRAVIQESYDETDGPNEPSK